MICAKFIFLYCFSLIFGWLGVNSFLIGLAYWETGGALAPAIAGALSILWSAVLITATVRLYYAKPGRDLIV